VPPTEEHEANNDCETNSEGNNEIIAEDTNKTETEDGNEDDDQNSNATIVQDTNESNNNQDRVSLAEGNDDDEGTQEAPTIQEEAIARQTTIETKNVTDLQFIPSSLLDQDLVVFGRLNAQLADAFAEQIEAAIARGVDSLPLLDDHCYRGSNESQNNNNSAATTTTTSRDSKSPKERLIETLRYKFVRNVDVLEAYCAHHVLTLRKHPPARRKRIVAVLRDGPAALDPPLDTVSDTMDDTVSDTMDDNGDDNGKASSQEQQPPAYPTSPSVIPTPEECTNLSRNLDRLRTEIAAARTRRNELKAELVSIQRAGDVAAAVADTVRESSETVDGVRSKVGGLVENSRVLDQLRDDAGRLMGRLDGIKRERDPSESENLGVDGDNNPLDLTGTIAKRPKSLAPAMEAYHRDRRALGLGLLSDSTNADGTSIQRGLELLKSVQRMLTASEPEQELE